MPVAEARKRPPLSPSEALILAGVLMLVLASVLPGWWTWRKYQRLMMAQADLRVLMESAQRYHQEYGGWPGVTRGAAADVRFGRSIPNAEVMNVLRAVEGPGNERHAGNEQQIIFIETEQYRPGWSGLDAEGSFLDPWGTPYQMVFDSNYDNVCHVEQSIYGRLIGQGFALWSCGPDQRSDTPDDLLSWQQDR